MRSLLYVLGCGGSVEVADWLGKLDDFHGVGGWCGGFECCRWSLRRDGRGLSHLYTIQMTGFLRCPDGLKTRYRRPKKGPLDGPTGACLAGKFESCDSFLASRAALRLV